MTKTSVREVLEAIAQSQSGLTDAEDARAAAPDPSTLPPALRRVHEATASGELATKLADPTFRSEFLEYVATIKGALDEGARAQMVAALRAAPKADSELRQKVFEGAFNCTLESVKLGDSGEEASAVPPAVLDKTVDILANFPTSHLPKKWKLIENPGPYTSGTYIPESGLAQFDFGADDAPAFDQAYLNAQPGDALEGTKCFDVMIRHEMGHAVHANQNGKALTDSKDGGGWQPHKTLDNVLAALDDLVGSFASAIKASLNMSVDPKAEVLSYLKTAQKSEFGRGAAAVKNGMANSKLEWFMADGKVPAWAGVTSRGAKLRALKDAIPEDHALLTVLIQGMKQNAFFELGSSPVAHDGRVYLDSGLGDDGWVSFDASTRDNMVSMYQYRAPGEWFAEFYATVNNASESVRKKGAAAYPAAYRWMKEKKMLIFPPVS